MLQKIKDFSSRSADFLGISASILCMIHCMVIPVMISMGYIFKFSDEAHEEHWHFLDYMFIALALVAVLNAAKNTNSKVIKIALWTAVSIFSVAIFLHEINPWMIVVSVASSLALLFIHIINWKHNKKCEFIEK
jgi:chromate transport protein ChrA